MPKYLPALLGCLLGHGGTGIVTLAAAETIDFGQVDWLNSLKGGYFNPKQEIRRGNPDDPTSYVGIFAKELIEEGDVLAQIPWEFIISAKEFDGEDDDDELTTMLMCGTVRNLAAEMKKGAQSKHAPYVQYLLNQTEGQLPSAWSEEGKRLLVDILGGEEYQQIPPVEPVDWLTEDWYEACHGDPEDTLSAHAAMLVVQRADDDLMVPIYDIYNHRNGKYHATKMMNKNEGENYIVQARRTIEPGEEIYHSYNMCDECDGRANGYGTPGEKRYYLMT
jgi:hypothetical protein